MKENDKAKAMILLVEDDFNLGFVVQDLLREEGYKVHLSKDGKEGLMQFNREPYDLILLDVMMPKKDGFSLAEDIRKINAEVPIIFLTARDNDFDTVSGLRMGADDYLTKDISMPHLLARIAALFRRQDALQVPAEPENQLVRGDLSLDLSRLTVNWKDQDVLLTVTEFWMLHALVKFPGHVKSRDALMQESKIYVDNSTITSHVKRMRKKFIQLDADFDCIDTVYGMGYRWNQPHAGKETGKSDD